MHTLKVLLQIVLVLAPKVAQAARILGRQAALHAFVTRARVLGAILAKALATLEDGFYGADGGRCGQWVALEEGGLNRSEVGGLRAGRVEGGRGRGE